MNGLGRSTIIITIDTDAVPLAYSEPFAFLESDDLLSAIPLHMFIFHEL